MAIAIDSVVAMKVGTDDRLGGVPTFGLVYGGASPNWDVLWDSGYQGTVHEDYLDEITLGVAPTEPALVRWASSTEQSDHFDAILVSSYVRDNTTTYLLLKSLFHDTMFEVPAIEVTSI
jgi:hypothetical protein